MEQLLSYMQDARNVTLACLLNRAMCALKLSQHTSAVTHATQALTLDPHSAKALFRRGQV